MPLYDYDCAACGRRFEVVHGLYAERPTVCPICGKGPIRKAISAAAVHYKGSGWAKKERRATATAAASKASGDDAPSDSPPAEVTAKVDGAGDGSSGTATPATAVKAVDKGSAKKATPAAKAD
jgi:putative FmdB family regulatory protein